MLLLNAASDSSMKLYEIYDIMVYDVWNIIYYAISYDNTLHDVIWYGTIWDA